MCSGHKVIVYVYICMCVVSIKWLCVCVCVCSGHKVIVYVYMKRWQEYIEELYKKELHDQDNHDGVITHLEPDILECEVKRALESI